MEDSHFVEELDGKKVEINAVRPARYDFGGFGWTFRVYGDLPHETLFSIVIECAQAGDDQFKQGVLEIGRRIVRQYLESAGYEKNQKYCYNWHPQGGLIEVDCKKRR